MGTFFSSHFFISFWLFQYFSVTYSTTLTITNKCNDIIWPVVWPSPGGAVPSGFALFPGRSQTLTVGPTWSGRVWARTHCSSVPTGSFLCATGDCGTSAVDCSSSSDVKPSPPVTVAKFTPYAYSVSVVDGYNLPAVVVPAGGGSRCATVGCVIDYGGVYYPPELRASYGNESQVAGIKSACTAFNTAEYCCSGNYSSESSCQPNSYSELFKKWCPQARTYAFDGTGTTFTCQFADFVVNFCSPTSSGFPSPGGAGNTGTVNPNDGSDDFGNNKIDYKFVIIISMVVGILGIFSIWYIWRKCFKADCEPCTFDCEPCTFSCCSIFKCSCCPGDHHHSDKC